MTSTRGFVKVVKAVTPAGSQLFFKPVRLNDVSPGLWLLCNEEELPFHWGFETLEEAQAVVDAWNLECERREHEVAS